MEKVYRLLRIDSSGDRQIDRNSPESIEEKVIVLRKEKTIARSAFIKSMFNVRRVLSEKTSKREEIEKAVDCMISIQEQVVSKLINLSDMFQRQNNLVYFAIHSKIVDNYREVISSLKNYQIFLFCLFKNYF